MTDVQFKQKEALIIKENANDGKLMKEVAMHAF